MISCKRVKNDKAVTVGNLAVGDTFLYDSKVCMIVACNGHTFPLCLENGINIENLCKPTTEVAKIDCELTYKVI